MSKTNETTKQILNYLFERRIFAWRENTIGVFDAKRGIYRPAPKKGISDIIAILPPHGRFCGIEIKTGKDRLSPEQQGFIENIQRMGGIALVVKDYEDFVDQFSNLST